MIDIKSLTKRYYTISEVSAMLDVNKSLLRYWETEIREIKPQKGSNGVRRYTAKDILLLEKIHDLLKVRGFTIDGARKELKKKPSTQEQKSLEERDKLKDILSRLKALSQQLK